MPAVDVDVFEPRGPVQRNKVLQAALAKARPSLPPTLECDAQIHGAVRRPDDHDVPGTDYTVRITYTERTVGSAAAALPVGTFGYRAVDDEDSDIDGVEKALDAVEETTTDALNATGQAPSGV